MSDIQPGDPIYVSSSDIAVAMSLGAAIVEGDSRLRIPVPLPDGVPIEAFSKWTSVEAKVTWLSEFVEMVSGNVDGVLNLSDVVGEMCRSQRSNNHSVRLYVPRSEMDRVRVIPGVRWSREIGMYVANSTADFGLIHSYLTESMKSVWLLDQNLSAELSSLVKARAVVAQREVEDPKDPPEREISFNVKENDEDI